MREPPTHALAGTPPASPPRTAPGAGRPEGTDSSGPLAMAPFLPREVRLLRGGIEESRHRVRIRVTDAEGGVLAATPEEDTPIFLRSAAKPFQALPLLEDGAERAFGVSDAELAVACGSHGGEEGHRVVVLRLLSRADAFEGDLACGPHPPSHRATAEALAREGTLPDRVHNNCSGKHAGMLLLASHRGWPQADYHAAGHPVQERMRDEVARWIGVPSASLATGVDGCGVVCFAAPLSALARGYAALKGAADAGDPGPERLVHAMVGHPFQVGGSGRLCTALLEAGKGRILAKVGAEGVYGAAWTPTPEARAARGLPAVVGIALKVEDGARRAAEVALVETLRVLGALDGSEAVEGAVAPWTRPPVPNTRGEAVAWLETVPGPSGRGGEGP